MEGSASGSPDNTRTLSRAGLVKAGGLVAATAAGVSLSPIPNLVSGDSSSAAAATSGSLLDTFVSTKRAKLGVDLTGVPLQYKNKQGKPVGYMIDVTTMMLNDMGNVVPEWVDLPFAQLVPGLAAGKFQMVGQGLTITPARALQGWFAGMPAFYESNVVLLKPHSKISRSGQLNARGVVIATLQGSAQAASAALLWPKATVRQFGAEEQAAEEVAVGRADAVFFEEGAATKAISVNKNLKLLPGQALFVDNNTYFMPIGDIKLWLWVTNWLRYNATHGVLRGLWMKWVGNNTVRHHISTSVIGAGGEAISVSR